jgi:hypothetical protein
MPSVVNLIAHSLIAVSFCSVCEDPEFILYSCYNLNI